MTAVNGGVCQDRVAGGHLIYAANRIPEIGRALGKGIRDFKRATRDVEDNFKDDDDDRPRSRVQSPQSEVKPK